MNKKIFTLFLLLIAIACGSYFVQQHAPDKIIASAGQISVVDGINEKVSLPKAAQSVVSMTAGDSELLDKLGVEPKGVVLSRDLPKDVMKKLSKYPNMGSTTGPSVERILQAKPDLVIGVAMPFQTTLRKTFSENGIPSYYHIAHSYDEIMKQITDIGKLTGKNKEAEALVSSYDANLKSIQERVKDKKKPRIIVVFGTPVSYQLATSETFVGDIFKKLGAINVADQYIKSNNHKTASEKDKENVAASMMEGFIPLNLETMSVLDADMVLIVMHGSSEGAAEAFKKAFRSPAWKNIPAIRDGKVYVLPGELFAFVPTARMNAVLNYGEEILYGK